MNAADYACDCTSSASVVTLRRRGKRFRPLNGGARHEHPHEVSTEAVDNFVGKLGTRAQSARLIGDCTGLLLF